MASVSGAVAALHSFKWLFVITVSQWNEQQIKKEYALNKPIVDNGALQLCCTQNLRRRLNCTKLNETDKISKSRRRNAVCRQNASDDYACACCLCGGRAANTLSSSLPFSPAHQLTIQTKWYTINLQKASSNRSENVWCKNRRNENHQKTRSAYNRDLDCIRSVTSSLSLCLLACMRATSYVTLRFHFLLQ